MNIQYYGDFCFKITTKPAGRATEDVVVVLDPCNKDSGFRAPQGQTDITLVSHESDASLAGIALDCPGEYDAKGIVVTGFRSFQDTEKGATRGRNTVFHFESEGISLVSLGALGHTLPSEVIDALGSVDILFVPAGNVDTLPVKELVELIRKIEPKIVIPMHYRMNGALSTLEDERAFCNEIGNCPESSVAKLTFKKKDIEEKSMEVVLFEKD